MSKRALSGGLGLLLAFALAAAPLWADSDVRIVRLSLVDGPVQLDRGTGEGFDRAITNMPITNGMRLWTRDDSRAEVEFEDGTTLRVTPGTKVDFTQLTLRENGKRSTVITLEDGEAYINFRHKDGEEFRIRAGDREFDLTKAVQLRIAVDPQRATIAVLNGELLADGTKIKKKHTAVWTFAGSGYQVAEGIVPDSEDAWNHDRDSYVQTVYNGNGFYGYNGLSSYGAWYGDCWQPFGVSAAWSPYSNGAWVYYPSFGYSWVSPYPWGWQTYRSGAWMYTGGSGWCWTPTRRYYGLRWAPVYNAPSGYVKPVPPVKPGPTGPVPPTHFPRDPRWRGPHGIVLVGNDGEPILRPWHRPHGGENPVGGNAFGGGGAGTSPATTNTTVPSAGRTAGPRDHRMLDLPANRTTQYDMMREQRQAQQGHRPMPQGSSEMQRGPRPMQSDRSMHEPRGFDRPNSAPHMSSPPPRTSAPSSAPRMSSPAPAPRMSSPAPAPRTEAPRSESSHQSAPHSRD